jgi:hypothetical protein
VLAEPSRNVRRHANVERGVNATQDVDERHEGTMPSSAGEGNSDLPTRVAAAGTGLAMSEGAERPFDSPSTRATPMLARGRSGHSP